MWFYFHFVNNTLSDFHIFIFHFAFCDVSVLCLCYILMFSFFLSCIYTYSLYILDVKSLSRITHANFTYSLEFALSLSTPCDGLILRWFPWLCYFLVYMAQYDSAHLYMGMWLAFHQEIYQSGRDITLGLACTTWQ